MSQVDSILEAAKEESELKEYEGPQQIYHANQQYTEANIRNSFSLPEIQR